MASWIVSGVTKGMDDLVVTHAPKRKHIWFIGAAVSISVVVVITVYFTVFHHGLISMRTEPIDPNTTSIIADAKSVSSPNCSAKTNINLIRKGTFSLPTFGVEYLYKDVFNWGLSNGTGHQLGLVASGANHFGRVKAPGEERQYLIMQTSGAFVTQNVSGFERGCKYYLNLLAACSPMLVPGNLTVLLDETTVLMPETTIPRVTVNGTFATYGPYEFTARNASPHAVF